MTPHLLLLRALRALLFLTVISRVSGQCGQGRELTFVKIAGFSPVTSEPPPLLYSAGYGVSITAECYNRCRPSADCLGFILDYMKSSCFKIPNVPSYRDKIEPNASVNYFFKLCLSLPGGCEERAWSLESTPGYELVSQADSKTIPNVSDKWECAQLCTNNTESSPCLSVNFHPSTRTCMLNSRDRWMDPESFIPTVHRESFYIENHCTDSEGDKCWHDPVFNQTSIRSDLQANNLTQEECKEKCGSEKYFRCRGYSYLEEKDLRSSQCLLHSDTANFSPLLSPSLMATQSGLYVEAIRCVNLSVSCDDSMMTVNLYLDNFEGMLYSRGHADSCYVQGKKDNQTTLSIPLDAEQTVKCGVRIAYAISDVNRTMASTVVVVQRHQLIQTASDSVVRVSCIMPAVGSTSNLTLTTGFSILDPDVQTEITGSGQTTEGKEGTAGRPSARISVIDPRTGKEPKQINLGDPVVIKIEVEPPYNASMVRAGHLIASSGTHTESLLLLDSRGCPPSVALFPPLTASDPQTLQAEFRAFRFPSSPILALSLVLTFCPMVCTQVDCGNGITSNGKRKKREVISGYQEIPLQLVLVIHSDGSEPNASSLLQASLGGDISTVDPSGQLCTSFLTAALLGLFWVLVQICLLAGCCWFVNRRQKEYADTISLRHDFQPRHVTWSDETERRW